MKNNEIPRRNRLDLNTLAELAIHNAMQEVEKSGADERLTEAVVLLARAKDCVADFVDGIKQESHSDKGKQSANYMQSRELTDEEWLAMPKEQMLQLYKNCYKMLVNLTKQPHSSESYPDQAQDIPKDLEISIIKNCSNCWHKSNKNPMKGNYQPCADCNLDFDKWQKIDSSSHSDQADKAIIPQSVEGQDKGYIYYIKVEHDHQIERMAKIFGKKPTVFEQGVNALLGIIEGNVPVLYQADKAIIEDALIAKISTDFFRYWWNTSGNNTDQGFRDWWKEHKGEYLSSLQSQPKVSGLRKELNKYAQWVYDKGGVEFLSLDYIDEYLSQK